LWADCGGESGCGGEGGFGEAVEAGGGAAMIQVRSDWTVSTE